MAAYRKLIGGGVHTLKILNLLKQSNSPKYTGEKIL